MPASRRTASRLAHVVTALRKQHGPVEPPAPANAFEHVLWEQVAYLATDERRANAFAELTRRVGLTPRAVLDADPRVLREIAALGGSVAVDDRVRHMQDAAAIATDGSLDSLAELPLPKAVRVLRQFHGIGEPGAERILLLTRAHKTLPLDSNGARVLLRIGYGTADKNYSAMYRSLRAATSPEIVSTFDWLTDAHLLLRHHGQTVCKSTTPLCEICSVRSRCDFARSRRTQTT